MASRRGDWMIMVVMNMTKIYIIQVSRRSSRSRRRRRRKSTELAVWVLWCVSCDLCPSLCAEAGGRGVVCARPCSVLPPLLPPGGGGGRREDRQYSAWARKKLPPALSQPWPYLSTLCTANLIYFCVIAYSHFIAASIVLNFTHKCFFKKYSLIKIWLEGVEWVRRRISRVQ